MKILIPGYEAQKGFLNWPEMEKRQLIYVQEFHSLISCWARSQEDCIQENTQELSKEHQGCCNSHIDTLNNDNAYNGNFLYLMMKVHFKSQKLSMSMIVIIS